MADELVTIQTFWNAGEAHLAKSRLEDADIVAFLENEYSVMITPHMANPSGIKLNVQRCDVQTALELLAPGK